MFAIKLGYDYHWFSIDFKYDHICLKHNLSRCKNSIIDIVYNLEHWCIHLFVYLHDPFLLVPFICKSKCVCHFGRQKLNGMGTKFNWYISYLVKVCLMVFHIWLCNNRGLNYIAAFHKKNWNWYYNGNRNIFAILLCKSKHIFYRTLGTIFFKIWYKYTL